MAGQAIEVWTLTSITSIRRDVDRATRNNHTRRTGDLYQTATAVLPYLAQSSVFLPEAVGKRSYTGLKGFFYQIELDKSHLTTSKCLFWLICNIKFAP